MRAGVRKALKKADKLEDDDFNCSVHLSMEMLEEIQDPKDFKKANQAMQDACLLVSIIMRTSHYYDV
jgi:hypothetical protein